MESSNKDLQNISNMPITKFINKYSNHTFDIVAYLGFC